MSLARACSRLCILLLTLSALIAIGCDQKHPPVVATPPPIVMVAPPVERPVTDHQVFTARTAAVESVDIKPRVTGYLMDILFKDGDLVKKGAVLFQIDDRPYKATLDQAVASLDFAKAALVKNQADYDIGLAVQKQSKGAISEQELTKRLGARDESTASVEKANAAIESAKLYYGWCKVTSPLDGRINRHFVDKGNLVSQDVTTLTNIVSIKPTWAYFDVDQNTALRVQQLVKEGKLKSAREGEPPVQMGLGAGEVFPIPGSIDFISNQLDPATGSIRVRARFENEDGSLLAGLFARMQVPTSAEHPALLVADQAIGTNQQQRFILVVNDQSVVEYREVDVGQLQADGLREVLRDRTIVEPGPAGKEVTKKVPVLKAGDRVIVNGLQRVRPGVKVDPKPVSMLTLLSESPGTEKKSATAPK